MKLIVLIAMTVLLLVACTSATEFGSCVGAFDNRREDLIYKVSAWNLSIAILGFSLVVPTVFVIVDETFCPVGKR